MLVGSLKWWEISERKKQAGEMCVLGWGWGGGINTPKHEIAARLRSKREEKNGSKGNKNGKKKQKIA